MNNELSEQGEKEGGRGARVVRNQIMNFSSSS